MDSERAGSSRPDRWLGRGGLTAALTLYATAFVVYAEKWAYTFDESFHLLAAQLINAGKRPYIDFCFPQTPLNAYWNAACMRLLGENWRVPHTFAALFTIGAVVLTTRFTFVRFPIPPWRAAAAATAALLTGLNAMVFIYGPVAQAYGICLFALVASFQLAVLSVDRSELRWPASVGFFAGTAVASSLLSAAAAPVLLAWMIFYSRTGSRLAKLLGFAMGAAIPLAPVLWLFSRGPRQVWFNLIEYHIYFRTLYWGDPTLHDIEILTSWIESGQALLIGLLALSGLIYLARRSQWPAALKAEFYLCVWLAAALSFEAGIAHPTFSRYFLLAVPFMAIVAAVGLYAIASRVFEGDRQLWAVLPLALFSLLGLGRSLYDRQDVGDWSAYERIAEKIEEVTPRDSLVFANEPVYFLTRRAPPPGLEFSYSHKVNLGPARNALMHIVTTAELKRELEAGVFATAYSCNDNDISDYGLANLYTQHMDVEDCSIFWDREK